MASHLTPTSRPCAPEEHNTPTVLASEVSPPLCLPALPSPQGQHWSECEGSRRGAKEAVPEPEPLEADAPPKQRRTKRLPQPS
jgi:hypothetical protein